MSGTVYLKIEKNVQIRSRSVYLKDIAQIVSDDSALENPMIPRKICSVNVFPPFSSPVFSGSPPEPWYPPDPHRNAFPLPAVSGLPSAFSPQND